MLKACVRRWEDRSGGIGSDRDAGREVGAQRKTYVSVCASDATRSL